MDEAVNLAQGVASGNANTVSFWLLPQWHSSAAKQATLKHRRLLEDKVIGCLALELQTCYHQFFTEWPQHFAVSKKTILGGSFEKFLKFFDIHPTQRALDTYEIAVNFTDAQHQGDRRKKSQQCFLAPLRIIRFNFESK